MLFENIFGSVAFVSSVIGLLPQIRKALITRSTRDLSMFMLINYCIGSTAWVGYGLYSKSLFVFFSNALGLCSSMFLLCLKRHYDRANPVN